MAGNYVRKIYVFCVCLSLQVYGQAMPYSILFIGASVVFFTKLEKQVFI